MSDSIKTQLDSIFPLKETTWNKLVKLAEEKIIVKNKNLVTKGSFFSYEIFVMEGVLRCYYVTEEDKEYTTSFYKEGDFVSPSFTRQFHGRSLLNIQALENCKVLLFEEHKFTALRHSCKDLHELGSKVLEKELKLKSVKEVFLATGNLVTLYQFFQDRFYGLEKRIPQRYIASFIGADPVSLSRIRAKILRERKTANNG